MGTTERVLQRFVASVNLRKLAPKSVGGKPALVNVVGMGKVWAEPPDGDDTFPPSIASYDFVDGWLVYRGRNGSEGAIVGKLRELQKWVQEVDKWTKGAPVKQASRPWEASDGGADNLKKATHAAKKVFPSVRLEFLVNDNGDVEGDHRSSGALVVNAHLNLTVKIGNSTVHSGSKTAAHEAAHEAFSRNPAVGRKVTEALKKWGKSVSLYHAMAGDFEGTMEAAAWWALAPQDMQRSAPELFEAVSDWLG